jgi:hypothetical protein
MCDDKNVDFHKNLSEDIKQYVRQKRLIKKKMRSVSQNHVPIQHSFYTQCKGTATAKQEHTWGGILATGFSFS